MEERLNITLCGIDGLMCHITPRRSNTLREIIREARILPSQAAQPLCLFRGNQVHVDIPLSSLNVNDGEVITVVFKKLTITQMIEEKAKHIQKLENDLYREALRIIDVQFNSLETLENSNLVYRAMLKENIEDGNKEVISTKKTNLVIPNKSISTDPLPICW
jgi:hypothetical protein